MIKAVYNIFLFLSLGSLGIWIGFLFRKFLILNTKERLLVSFFAFNSLFSVFFCMYILFLGR